MKYLITIRDMSFIHCKPLVLETVIEPRERGIKWWVELLQKEFPAPRYKIEINEIEEKYHEVNVEILLKN